MRPIVAALTTGLVCLALPAAAGAAITPTSDATTIAAALDGGGSVTGASFTELPPSGTPHGTGDDAGLAGFPRAGGTFAVLTTGDASIADDPAGSNDNELGAGPAHGFQGAPGNAYDTSVLRLAFTAAPGQTCLSFDYRFLSEEWPENVGDSVNDGFVAVLDSSFFATDPVGDLSAPENFALDADGELISVNTATMTAEEAAGPYDGATPLLTAQVPVTPGPHQLYLAIFDQGDEQLDSAALVDNLSFSDLNGEECGGAPDRAEPAVSITEPAEGATVDEAFFAGQAGAGATDSANVTVQVYEAGAATPVAVLGGARDDRGAWTSESALLPSGSYEARAHQTDAAGNVGVSATRTLTIGTPVEPTPTPLPAAPPPPPPPPPPDPQPDQGRSVVVGTVSGTVRVKTRGGRFRTLGAIDEIPLGSTVDATRGRVRLTSAAGGGAVQTADFYRGQFLVTQTRGRRPITQLRLNAAMRCGKGRASAARKRKKVRRLWGNGTGRFRTRGRHGAATVRGTRWLTQDRCNSTKFTVRRGSIKVRDFVKKRNRVVRQGKSFTVRKKKR